MIVVVGLTRLDVAGRRCTWTHIRTARWPGYHVTKHAVLAPSECLAADLATVDAPVRVSVALPGPVDTRIFTDANAHTAGGAVVEGQLDSPVPEAMVVGPRPL